MILGGRKKPWLAVSLIIGLSACSGSLPGKGSGTGGAAGMPETGGTTGTRTPHSASA